MPLYLIQDHDWPACVVADGWQHAINKWKVVMAKENDTDTEDITEPQGVTLVAEDNELIVGSGFRKS